MALGMRLKGSLLAISIIVFAAGIAHATPSSNGPYINGPYINGPYINGPYINGPYINGTTIGGTAVSGIQLADGRTVDYAWLSASELYGWVISYDQQIGSWTWTFLSGTDFVGATTHGLLGEGAVDSGKIVELRITGTTMAAPDVRLYDVEIRTPGATEPWRTAWQPACGCEPGTGETVCSPLGTCWTVPCSPVEATVALNGAWDTTSDSRWGGSKITDDPNVMTFACINAALGKCAADGRPNTLGYAPWRTSYHWEWHCTPPPDAMSPPSCTWEVASIDYVDEHQACTRMIRADYCGDGTPHTLAGTDIEVYDHNTAWYGAPAPQNWDTRPGLPFEGTWTPLGAHDIGFGRCYMLPFQCKQHDGYAHAPLTACWTDEPPPSPPAYGEDPDPPLVVTRVQPDPFDPQQQPTPYPPPPTQR
jgi:ADYC domain-containing protein